ncbi:MAG: CBS domain-containing protein, partial [Planctomycetales bacterium]|nr:CBS domain-containing protein [Planctomycetales bacterium]
MQTDTMETDTVQQTHYTSPLCVEHDALLCDVLLRLRDEKTGGAFVVRDGQLAGIYTERDALKLMANGGKLDVPVSQVMTKTPVAVKPGDSVAAAIRKMSQGGYR